MNATTRMMAAPGFEHIVLRRDNRLGAMVATLHPGDYYVSERGEWIATVLGSCVSACIRDPRLGIGGMNHFMLPMDSIDSSGVWNTSTSAATRFGNVAMERLVNAILSRGGQRSLLEIKLVGGGKVLDAITDVGARNIQFVRDYVRAEGLRVVGEDLGDVYPRKVLYDPATGNARVKRLARAAGSHVANDEKRYLQHIDHVAVGGEIELF